MDSQYRPESAASFANASMASSSRPTTGRPSLRRSITATPLSIVGEGDMARDMMKRRLSRQVSFQRRSSVLQQQTALAEFQRRHGINRERQRLRLMYHLFCRKAKAVGKMVLWCKVWRKDIEAQVRTEDWYFLSEKLLFETGHIAEQIDSYESNEFMTVMAVDDPLTDKTSYVELRFNKADFKVDRKTQTTVLSPIARAALRKEPGTRENKEILEICRCLKIFPSFQKFPHELQKEIVSWGTLDCYEKNRVLCKYGRRSDGWYIVLFGKLVLRPPASSGTAESKLIGVGQIYGEDEVVLNLTRSYTAVAFDDTTEVLFIHRQDYVGAKNKLEGSCRIDDVRKMFSTHPTLCHFKFDKLSSTKGAWQAQTFQPGAMIAKMSSSSENPDPDDPNFSVANLTVSELLDNHSMEQEKKKYFCVVQKGSADVYGVCKESEFRKNERHLNDPVNEHQRELTMLHIGDNETRKMNKFCKDTQQTEKTGFMRLLPTDWSKTPGNREIKEKISRRFRRTSPFMADNLDKLTWPENQYENFDVADKPADFVIQRPSTDLGKQPSTTFAKIGRAEPGAVFGMESTVTAALEPWKRDSKTTGIQAKELGVENPPDIFFVSNGCQVVLVDKSVYTKGLGRDAKCLTASQMPFYADKATVFKARDENDKWKTDQTRRRAEYRQIMAKCKKMMVV